MHVRLTHIDGKLPNLALMKLARWHGERGDRVTLSRSTARGSEEPLYDRVYGSTIFAFSADKTARLRETWPEAIVGGTGTTDLTTVEQVLDLTEFERYDYSLYPWYEPSLGFTQRGCRLACKFCVVPRKEGKPRSVNTIADIWRGPGHPKKLHLLDNDFFGQPEADWRARIEEMHTGKFRVCFNQGINVRAITPESAAALASVEYRDDQFQRRRLYTAWDNLKDENVFFRGMDMLREAGIPAKHVMSYMLVGWDKRETWDTVVYRFARMASLGIRPYPMVFDCRSTDQDRYRLLKQFQRWAVTGLYRFVPFELYDVSIKVPRLS